MGAVVKEYNHATILARCILLRMCYGLIQKCSCCEEEVKRGKKGKIMRKWPACDS